MASLKPQLSVTELVGVTEAGAIAAYHWSGKGAKTRTDSAATDEMRSALNRIHFRAEIAIGEGKKDESFGLYEGEVVGISEGDDFPKFSIAVDPVEGTTPVANGAPGAISVMAIGDHGCFYQTQDYYMDKFAVGPNLAGCGSILSIDRPIEENVKSLAVALFKPLDQLTVCVLDRPRNAELILRLRMKCRVKLIQDCDVVACIATCLPESGIDMYVGTGGAPEAVITAAAMKCLGGFFQAAPTDKSGIRHDSTVYGIADLARGEVSFCATGITDSLLVKGISEKGSRLTTDSFYLSSIDHKVRRIQTQHRKES
jgi:fructose-1,6-bisphosphatase class II